MAVSLAMAMPSTDPPTRMLVEGPSRRLAQPARAAHSLRGLSPEFSPGAADLVHRLTLFGGASLTTEDGPVTGQAGQRRRLALLALLARSPNYTLSRDKVIALLWPESTTSEARHLLSVSLHAFRKELAENVVRTLGDDLRLDQACLTVDVWDFERALLAGDYDRAIGLYAGPFLDGVHVSGADEFVKWADDERAELANRYATALERAAESFSTGGDHIRAVEMWRKRSQLDPYQGRLALAYMRALVAAGDRAGAIQHARTYATLLRTEYRTEPEPAILQLAKELTAEAATTWAPSTPTSAQSAVRTEEPVPQVTTQAPVDVTTPTPLVHRAPQVVPLRRLTVVLLIAAAAVLVWNLRPPAPLDPNSVVGYPLRDLDAKGGDNSRGDEVAVAIGSALELTDQIRWIDGWTMLVPNERTAAQSVELSRQLGLARESRARYVLLGQIFDDGDRTTVRLIAHDVQEDSAVAQASESGTSATESAVGLSIRALNKMLPRLLASGGRAGVDLTSSDITRHAPAAVAAWLRAERDYRTAHYQEALAGLARALAIDSTLGIAALRAATAANWLPKRDTALILVQRALANPATLSGRQLAFARGLLNFLEGRADSALSYYSAALRAEPTWGEAHMASGEVYHFSFPSTDSPDSLAERSFALAANNDPEFAPPLYYLTQYAILRGELNSAESHFRKYAASARDSSHVAVLQLMLDCARARTPRTDWAAVLNKFPTSVWEAARLLSVRGSRLDCAESGYRAILNAANLPTPERYRWAALQGLSGIYGATKRYADMRRVFNEGLLSGERSTYILALVAAEYGAPVEDLAAQALGTLGGPWEPQNSGVLWYRGTGYAQRAHIDSLASFVAHLHARVLKNPDRATQMVADGLRVRLLLARVDTSNALALLRKLRPNAPPDRIRNLPFEALAWERIMLARLLLARRQYVDAIRAAETFDRPQPDWYLPHLGESLRIRASAARVLDLDDRANEYEARLRRLETFGNQPSSRGAKAKD